MKQEVDRLDKVLISHDKRLTFIERVMWLVMGLTVGVILKHPIEIVEFFVRW